MLTAGYVLARGPGWAFAGLDDVVEAGQCGRPSRSDADASVVLRAREFRMGVGPPLPQERWIVARARDGDS